MPTGKCEKAYGILPSARSSINSPSGSAPAQAPWAQSWPGQTRTQANFADNLPLVPSRQVTLGRGRHSARAFRLTGRGLSSARWGELETASRRLPLGPVPARLLGEDHHLRSYPRDVEQPTLLQSLPEGLGDPVAGIGDDHIAGQEPLATNLVEQLQGNLALGPLAAAFLRDTGLLETLGRTRPGLGDEEPKCRREMPVGSDVVDRDGHLTVGLLAQLAAVLTLHTDGVLALLGEAGIVDDEDPLGAGQGTEPSQCDSDAEPSFVPGALVDELLQGLFGVFDVKQFRRPGTREAIGSMLLRSPSWSRPRR